jgi:hypothetical protein
LGSVSDPCPRCGSHNIHHSRLRTWFERARRRVTRRAPYRCRKCEWRGWRHDDARASGDTIRQIHRELTDAELERLDPDRRG